jgi:threonine/homoserine/homoserine lactone efflux protein
MDQAEVLDHQFVAAAYTLTWILQLGYLAWLGWKWRQQRRDAERRARSSR